MAPSIQGATRGPKRVDVAHCRGNGHPLKKKAKPSPHPTPTETTPATRTVARVAKAPGAPPTSPALPPAAAGAGAHPAANGIAPHSRPLPPKAATFHASMPRGSERPYTSGSAAAGHPTWSLRVTTANCGGLGSDPCKMPHLIAPSVRGA